MTRMLPIAVLISGSGTNLQALIDASQAPGFGCDIRLVVSDRPGAYGLTRAADAGIATAVVNYDDHDDRDRFTEAIVETTAEVGAEALVLAGLMRILGPAAIKAFPDAILNIHPSMLPAYPGSNAVEQALADHATETGATVHFVDELVDHGPIIVQETVPVLPNDDAASLHARIQQVEHRLFPKVVSAFGRGEITVDQGRAIWNVRSNQVTA